MHDTIIHFKNTSFKDLKEKFKDKEFNVIKIYGCTTYPSVVEVLRAELFNLFFTNSRPDKDSIENQINKGDILKKMKQQAVFAYVPKYDLESYNSILQFINISNLDNNVFINTKEFQCETGYYDKSSNSRVWGIEVEEECSKVCYTYAITCRTGSIDKWSQQIIIYGDSFFEVLDIFLDFLGTLNECK